MNNASIHHAARVQNLIEGWWVLSVLLIMIACSSHVLLVGCIFYITPPTSLTSTPLRRPSLLSKRGFIQTKIMYMVSYRVRQLVTLMCYDFSHWLTIWYITHIELMNSWLIYAYPYSVSFLIAISFPIRTLTQQMMRLFVLVSYLFVYICPSLCI